MEFSNKFVCEDINYSTFSEAVNAPIFRKSFILEKMADTAEILICGLGFYDLYINGKKITKGYLAPYISNSDHYTYFDKYNIKPYLNIGENVIGIMLGDGHQVGKTTTWNFNSNVTNSAPLLALTTELKFGEEIVTFEADDFVCKKGPITFNDLRGGVFYDARLDDGWKNVGYTEEGWHKPISLYKPRGTAKICEAEPIRINKELKPISIKKGEVEPYETKYCEKVECAEGDPEYTGGYIYDFGENNAGIFRLKINGKPGQRIEVQTAEQFSDDGRLSYKNWWFLPEGYVQRDVYYCKGEGEEVYEPQFVYHGFRYLYVTGITEEQATEDLLTYLCLSSDLEERGTFECSDEMANTIYQMGRRSDISNFFYFPVDCPHREKNGWTGDVALSAEHMIMTIGAEKSFREWSNNIRAAQNDKGAIPAIVPTDKWGYERYAGPAWDAAWFNMMYVVYKYRGETEMISENAGAMLKYLDFVSQNRNEKGTVLICVLGDWLPTNNYGKPNPTDPSVVDTIAVIDICRKCEEMFKAAKLPLYAELASKLGKEIYDAMRKNMIDAKNCAVINKTQTTQAMAIFFDIFTEEEKPRAFEHLMELICANNNNFDCGCMGLRVLFHVLSQFGEAELAYKMITKTDFPSYGYWAAKGETTMLEQFYEYKDYFFQSKNHHFFGDVVNWFMSSVGGLNVVNSDYVKVSPQFIEKLDWCKTTHKLPGGKIEISWQRCPDGVDLKVATTGNVKFEIAVKGTVTEKTNGVYLIS